MIAGEQDVRIAQLASPMKRLDYPPDVLVDRLDLRAVLPPRDGDLLGVERLAPPADPPRLGLAGRADRLGHGRAAPPLAVFRRRIERVVRPDEAHEEMPREVVPRALDPLGGTAADVGVLPRVGGQDRIVRGVDVPPVARALPVVGVKLRQQAPLLEPVGVRALGRGLGAGVHLALALARVREPPAERARPVAVPAVVAVRLGQVQLAHAPHAVAVIAQPLVVRRRAYRQERAVVRRAEADGLEPAGQADPRRRADGRVRETPREDDALTGDPVQVRRADEVRARRRQVVRPELVRHDQQHVRSLGWIGHKLLLLGKRPHLIPDSPDGNPLRVE